MEKYHPIEVVSDRCRVLLQNNMHVWQMCRIFLIPKSSKLSRIVIDALIVIHKVVSDVTYQVGRVFKRYFMRNLLRKSLFYPYSVCI